VRRHFEALNVLVEAGEWLLGVEFSYADIGVRAMTYVMNRAQEGEEMLGEYAAIRSWELRVDERTLPGGHAA
jgi:glutathione S-transferase